RRAKRQPQPGPPPQKSRRVETGFASVAGLRVQRWWYHGGPTASRETEASGMGLKGRTGGRGRTGQGDPKRGIGPTHGSAKTRSVSVATTATYCLPFLPR